MSQENSLGMYVWYDEDLSHTYVPVHRYPHIIHRPPPNAIAHLSQAVIEIPTNLVAGDTTYIDSITPIYHWHRIIIWVEKRGMIPSEN
jgi:hypothetical protein